jgi:hypothetical protein
MNMVITALQSLLAGAFLLWLVAGLALVTLVPLAATFLDSLGIQISLRRVEALGLFLKGFFAGAFLLWVFHAYTHPDPVKPCLDRAMHAPSFEALRESYIQKYPPSHRVALWKLTVDLRVSCYREHLEAQD